MIKNLSKYMKGYWAAAVGSIIAMLVEVTFELQLPNIAGDIYDIGVNGTGGKQYVIKYGVLMIAMALIAMSGGITCMKLSSIASQGFAHSLRNATYEKISTFSFKNIDEFSTASLTTRMTNDITAIQNTIMMCLRMLVRAPAMLVVAAFFSVKINPQMSSIILVILPFVIVIVALVLKFGFPMFQKMQKRIDSLNRVVQENLIGIRVVKAFVREDYEKEKFKKANNDLMAQGKKASGLIITAMPIMLLIFNSIVIFIYWQGGNKINNGTMTVGELTKFANYLMIVIMNLVMVSMMLIQVARAKACAMRIGEVLNTESDIKNKERTVSPAGKGKVEFKNVNFRYSTQTSGDDILEDISFVANPGDIVGIIGSTGSGKSSLVSLIPRLYDATSGQVLIDDVDVKDYNIKELREMIGVVLQKNVLFSGSIKENIRWGKKDATDEEIEKACRNAQAHDFILRQPKGYDTDLSQGGLNLSGGQKQRLCIARAMIKNPKILILDDSTSAVDTATEAKIREAFYNELKETTVFIIAQRISSVKDADKIIVLDDGKISGIGSHSELMESNEIYREIYTTQQKGVLE